MPPASGYPSLHGQSVQCHDGVPPPVVGEGVVGREDHVGNPPLAVPQGSDPFPFDDLFPKVEDRPQSPRGVAFDLPDVARSSATVAHADPLPIEDLGVRDTVITWPFR